MEAPPEPPPRQPQTPSDEPPRDAAHDTRRTRRLAQVRLQTTRRPPPPRPPGPPFTGTDNTGLFVDLLYLLTDSGPPNQRPTADASHVGLSRELSEHVQKSAHRH